MLRSDLIVVVQANMAFIDAEAFDRECARRNIPIQFLKPFVGNVPPHDLGGCENIPYSAHVVFFGSLVVMKQIINARDWKPGGWCDFENFRCSTFYPRFGRFVTNHQYALMPVGDVYRNREFLSERIGSKGEFFIRPDAADKSFTGCVVDADDVEKLLKPYRFDGRELAVIATPKEIQSEWRLVIANSRVVAGCQYRIGGELTREPGAPDEVQNFASRVLAETSWRPAPIFILDVAETVDGLSIMEINPFNCSSMMECDLGAVLDAVIAQAAMS